MTQPEPAPTGQPGDGCLDPRDIHLHRCEACGFGLTFSAAKCRALPVVPHCEMCGESRWQYEITPPTTEEKP